MAVELSHEWLRRHLKENKQYTTFRLNDKLFLNHKVRAPPPPPPPPCNLPAGPGRKASRPPSGNFWSPPAALPIPYRRAPLPDLAAEKPSARSSENRCWA